MTKTQNSYLECPLGLSGCPSNDAIKIYEERAREEDFEKKSDGTSRLENEINGCYYNCEKFRVRIKRDFPFLDGVLCLKGVSDRPGEGDFLS